MSVFTVRAGSEDPLDFTLQHDSDGDGVIDAPIDLTGAQSVTLKLRRWDGVVVEFATTDVSPQLVIVNAAEGTLRFSPDEMTWANGDGWYAGYFLLIDVVGQDIPVPEDGEFEIVVRDQFVVTP